MLEPWLIPRAALRDPRHWFESHIVCNETAHLDQFSIDNLVSADSDSFIWQLASSKSWQIARRRQSWLLLNTIRQRGARILHSHFGDRGWANIGIANDTGVKHVVTFYGYDVSRLPHDSPDWKDRYARLFTSADLFLCEGPHLGQALESLGCPPSKIRIHHLGVDVDRLTFRSRQWRPDEPLRVLMAGSFVEKKGLPYAIEALGRLKDRVALEIEIVGDADEQDRSREEKEKIQAAIDANGLRSRTHLLGYRSYSELLEIAYRNHLFLSPSVTASDGDTEGGAPVSLIEMAASGMPVVSTRHCDIPEVLQDGETGLLAEERDVDGLERRLCWLLDHPDRWEPMVRAARRHIENEFSAVVQGRRLGSHYEGLMNDG